MKAETLGLALYGTLMVAGVFAATWEFAPMHWEQVEAQRSVTQQEATQHQQAYKVDRAIFLAGAIVGFGGAAKFVRISV